MIDARHPAVVQDGRRVEDVVALVHEADHRRQPAGGARDVLQRAQVGLDERRLEEQVLGRIAGHRQLGERHEPAALGARLVEPGADLRHIALEVADGGIDLAEADPEAAHGVLYRAAVAPGRIVNTAGAVIYAAFHKPPGRAA